MTLTEGLHFEKRFFNATFSTVSKKPNFCANKIQLYEIRFYCTNAIFFYTLK